MKIGTLLLNDTYPEDIFSCIIAWPNMSTHENLHRKQQQYTHKHILRQTSHMYTLIASISHILLRAALIWLRETYA